jgi:hypothetical protein
MNSTHEKDALLLEDLVVEVSEGLEHIFLGLLEVFVMLPGVKGIKIFTHLGLLSSKA